MHHIQRSIVLNLARTSPLRFTDLQPPRIPNNTFSYHLKKLINGGYISLTGEGYIPTRKALKIVAFGISAQNAQPNPRTISIIYIENAQGEILLINRNHKPFQGWYGLPSGLIHQGETLMQAARRELYEKTTIRARDGLERVGVLDFRYLEPETRDIFVHAIAFVYKYKYTHDRTLLNDKVTRYGQLSWSKLGRQNILSEVFIVKKLAARGESVYSSVNFEEPTQQLVLADDNTPGVA